MEKSYTKNYLKIYFVQILSVLVGFASLLVVVPIISGNKPIYGIYSICTSIVVFLSYADIGFLGAGTKFAAEDYARNDKKNEMAVLGFSCAILLLMILIFSGVILYFSFTPSSLISDVNEEEQEIAQKLLLILGASAPILGLLRVTQSIYGVRVLDYEIQVFYLIGNILKILSVFVFFTSETYDIVGFFFFYQINNLLVLIAAWLRLTIHHKYSIGTFIKNIKLSKGAFDRTKALAVSSLFLTLCWVLYYELDNVALGKLLGPEAVACYSIGFTLLSLIRTFLGIFFSPFSARFNHFVGLNDMGGLKNFFLDIVKISFPIVVFILLPLFLYSKDFVVAWVGNEYDEALVSVKLLVLCNLFAFVNYPMGMILMARQRLKAMYFSSVLLPIVFWTGVVFTIGSLQEMSFSLFKLVAFTISSFVYIVLMLRYFQINLWHFIKKIVLPYIPGIMVVLILSLCIPNLNITQKGIMGLIKIGTVILVLFTTGFGISFFFSQEIRYYLKNSIIPLFTKTKS